MLKGVNGNRLRMWPASACSGIREHAEQTTGQAHQFGGVRVLEKLRSSMDGSQQFPRVANIQRNGDRNQGDAVPQVRPDRRCRAD